MNTGLKIACFATLVAAAWWASSLPEVQGAGRELLAKASTLGNQLSAKGKITREKKVRLFQFKPEGEGEFKEVEIGIGTLPEGTWVTALPNMNPGGNAIFVEITVLAIVDAEDVKLVGFEKNNSFPKPAK